jgi:hypothetical protein
MVARFLLSALSAVWLSAATAPAAHANPVDGNNLLARCTSKTPIQISYCRGFILGVTDGAFGWEGSFDNVALPKGAADTQLTDIVVRYLQAHPEWRHMPGYVLIVGALGEAFPAQPQK